MELFGIRRAFRRHEFICRGGYWEICRIAYPLVIMSASNSIMQFVDRKFLAEHSTLDVAASMPAGILYFTQFSFFMVTCNFTSALVAQYHGANDRDGVLRAVWAGQCVALVAGLFITFVIPPLGDWIIRNNGHSAELIARELDYFHSLIPSGVFICAAAPFFAFFSGQGRTIPVAVINISGCILNIFLDYAFIFGKWGVPPMGIFGAGIATSICCFSLMTAVMVYFYCQNQRRIPTRRRWRFEPGLIGRLFRFGTPAGFQTFADVGAFTLIAFLIGNLGELALAASVIALAINNIFFIPLMGLSDSTAIVVGQYIGRRRHGTAEKATYRAWRIAALYMMFGAVLYLGFPEVLADFFSSKESSSGLDFNDVRAICVGVLAVVTVFNACDSLKYIFMGAMRGAGDTIAVFLLNSLTAWCILVPGTVLFTRVWPLPVTWVWAFTACVGFLDAMLFLWRFRSGHWRKIRLIERRSTETPLEELARQNP